MKEKKIENNKTLISIVDPKPNSTIMIYDVHASESGALSILNDLYSQVRKYSDKTVKWIFVVSTPDYEECENITVCRFPWVKKNWGYRLYFEMATTRKLLRNYSPDKVFSLQNKGISYFKKEQYVYLHLPFILTEHRFTIKDDGKKLWLYQNIISKNIFSSLRKVNCTIVQTQWMKDALANKARVDRNKIVIMQPDITSNTIGNYIENTINKGVFFYPATPFSYKNHMTLLKGIKYAVDLGMKDYELILTLLPNENKLTEKLYKYSIDNNLNVDFRGKISREEVFEIYTRSTLVFPSYVESFGLPLLEARLSGAYIISSDCSFSREILEKYDRVQYFDEMDYQRLGELIYKRSR